MKIRSIRISGYIGFLMVTACVLSQCKFGPEPENSYTIETELKRGKNLNPKEWQCYDVENNKICIPFNWEFVKQDKLFFFASLNNDRNTFFTVIKFDVNVNKLNAYQYLKEGYAQLQKDTSEVFTGYTLKKLTFQDKETYYGEYFTTIDTIKYFSYSMVFELDGFVYGIALKTKDDVSSKYKDTFRSILFNFRVNDEPVFDESDEIEKIEVVDLSTDKIKLWQ